jgi:predicted AAA+ superfamily ATPase
MDKQRIKEVVIDQNTVRMPDNAITRELFNQAASYIDSGRIVIISGLRRCGKSTLMQQLRLRDEKAPFYLNFDDDRLAAFTVEDFQALLEVFIELYGQRHSAYFDEIQNVEGWERFARRLNDEKYTVFITGSNATMLSRELGTRLTGRYVQLELFPFSFREHVNFTGQPLPDSAHISTVEKSQVIRCYHEYLLRGGIPEYVRTADKQYLHYLYEGILYRDIIGRHSLTREKAIKELVLYLASNVGKEMSYNSLTRILGLGSPNTVSEYCGYLEETYLLFLLPRYSTSLKKQIQFPKKTYMIDTALAESIGFRWSEDGGRMLENVVFTELRRRGHEVFFHRDTKECDFLLRSGVEITSAIQVCKNLADERTRRREMDGLREALSAYNLQEGLIITEDEEKTEQVNTPTGSFTIRTTPAWKWLLGY